MFSQNISKVGLINFNSSMPFNSEFTKFFSPRKRKLQK